MSGKITEVRDSLVLSPKYARQVILLLLDLALIPCAMCLAVIARVGMLDIPEITNASIAAMALTTALSLGVFMFFGLYRAVVRFMGGQAIVAVIKAVTISAALFSLAAFLTQSWMPRSLPFIYWLIAIALIGGSRLIIRAVYQRSSRCLLYTSPSPRDSR